MAGKAVKSKVDRYQKKCTSREKREGPSPRTRSAEARARDDGRVCSACDIAYTSTWTSREVRPSRFETTSVRATLFFFKISRSLTRPAIFTQP